MIFSEALHYASIAPLLLLLAFRRDVGAAYWFVALGFAVSFFMDMTDSWAVSHVLPAIQLGFFAWAFGAAWVMPVLVTLAAVQIIGTDLSGPDIYVTLVGSMLVVHAAVGHPLLPAMLAYCGVATILYVLMVGELFRPAFMPLWYGYQGSRLLAFGLFIGAAHREASRA